MRGKTRGIKRGRKSGAPKPRSKTSHVLLQRKGRTTLIAAGGNTIKSVVKSAQPIINRHPKSVFRYATLKTNPFIPAFRKGE